MILGFFTWIVNIFILWILDGTPAKEEVKENKPIVQESKQVQTKSVEYSIKTPEGWSISFPNLTVCKVYESQYSGGKCAKKVELFSTF